MSSNHSESTSDSDESIDEAALVELKERVEDLEVEVYGYDRSRDLSAGDRVVVNIKQTVVFVEKQHRQRTEEDERYTGAPLEQVYDVAEAIGMERGLAEHAMEKLRRQGEVYEPASGMVKAT